jgi:FkbM family methyltransferase
MSSSPENYNFDELNFDYLQALVGDARGAIVEIGANNGDDTRRLLDAFPNAPVYAFEPDPRAIEKFHLNVRDARARLLPCAIGAQEGQAVFHMSGGAPDISSPEAQAWLAANPGGWDKSGSLHAPKSHLDIWPGINFDQKATVAVTTLDKFFHQENLHTIDLIWADTQGAESDMIAGGAHALSRTRYLYTEYCNEEWYEGQINLDQLLALLPGFKVIERFSTDVLLENQALKAQAGGGLAKRLRKLFFS